MLFGAPSEASPSQLVDKAYVIFGKASDSGWDLNVNISNADISFLSDSSDHQGFFVTGAGDINGDEINDILIGCPSNDEVGLNSGRVSLFLGKMEWATEVFLATDAEITFFGEGETDFAGRCMAGAGDINGDGIDDFLIGSPMRSEGGTQAGKVYFYIGVETPNYSSDGPGNSVPGFNLVILGIFSAFSIGIIMHLKYKKNYPSIK